MQFGICHGFDSRPRVTTNSLGMFVARSLVRKRCGASQKGNEFSFACGQIFYLIEI